MLSGMLNNSKQKYAYKLLKQCRVKNIRYNYIYHTLIYDAYIKIGLLSSI